ncbi:glycosyl transferase [Pyrobaculum aerophilum]|uniref:Glycosyl transferase n=2 Tax=Pyrobaculum aerophilum TaxID=13773 RepID=A0A371QVW6_9CREN|nr:glycosyl transferase [Pyrobaculum aerophilum]RFA94309.1 glycosyl transferase [Pyrobaculum aerophilum]
MKWSYITIFDPRYYPRPLFFYKCCKLPVFYLRTFIGYLRNPSKKPNIQKYPSSGVSSNFIRDPLESIYKCQRQDNKLLIDSLIFEALYAPYVKKIDSNGVIVMNPHGVFAAKGLRRKVILDLMDLWSCEDNIMYINAVDYKAMKKADYVIAWSKAIREFLRKIGVKNVVYLPLGIDLTFFDPTRYEPYLFFNKYPHVIDKFRVVYSGGLWYVNNREVLGVLKLLKAFKIIETKRRDVALLIQAPSKVVEMAKEVGVKNFIYVERTTNSNDPLRLSFLRSADILVLTGSKYPSVYLAERTTMFQYMATGRAILAEMTLGVRGVLRHGETGYLVEIDKPESIADAILELVKDDGLRKYIGRNARFQLEQYYTWDKLYERAKFILT